MNKVIDIKEKCVDCRKDTSLGSIKFIDRIDGEFEREINGEIKVIEGYQCAECRLIKCESKDCDRKVIDDYEINFDGEVICMECIDKVAASERRI